MQGQVHTPLSFSGQQQQPDWDSEFTKVEAASQDKGKGRLVEVSNDDLEAAFDRLDVKSTEKPADPTASLDDYMASFEKCVTRRSWTFFSSLSSDRTFCIEYGRKSKPTIPVHL